MLVPLADKVVDERSAQLLRFHRIEPVYSSNQL
jgi:hypothetical protein